MATEHDDVEFEGVIEATSSKAIKFQAETWEEAEWIPRSQCEVVPDRESERSGKATVYIRRWLCKKNGWVDA